MAAVTDRVRVGVVGLGAIAQAVHLPLLARRWDLFEVVALADLSASRTAQLATQYGVRETACFATADELLGAGGLDGVVLLTSGSHGADASAALRAGVPVFCEKPMAYTVAEADQLADAEREFGRPGLLLGYMKERDPAVVRLRELLRGVEGVRAVDVRVLHPSGESQLAFANLRPAPHDVDADRAEALGAAEGTLLDAALGAEAPDALGELYAHVVLGSIVHNISLVRSLLGGLDRIDSAIRWPVAAMPPSVEVAGWTTDGVRVRISWHYLPEYPAYRETFTVHHARGSAEVGFGTPYRLNPGTRLSVVSVDDVETLAASRGPGDAFEAELVEFYRLITAGQPPVAGVPEGRADIVTSQRIMRALAEGEGGRIGGEAATA